MKRIGAMFGFALLAILNCMGCPVTPAAEPPIGARSSSANCADVTLGRRAAKEGRGVRSEGAARPPLFMRGDR